MTGQKITVLNPRGIAPPIQLIPMAPRLDTLEGKTIYLAGINFRPLHQGLVEIHRVLTERYPKTTFILKVKEGSYFVNDQKLWDEIKEKGDGVIIGVGQLDTNAPAVVIFSSILEKMGVPTVPVVTAGFPGLTKSFAYKKGIPELRLTFIPHPFSARPVELQRKYIEGNDPISGRPIIEQIVDALTKSTTAEETKTGVIERPRQRILGPDTPENLEQMFLEEGWTDGMPIILPTEERVAEMLKGTSHKPDEIIGMMQPTPPNDAWETTSSQLGGGSAPARGAKKQHTPVTMQPSPPYESWEYTVEHVAINAVMAGARKEHLPVILAIASTGVTSLFSSCSSFARMVVTNGPIRKEINMNSGLAALGPFNHANSVIGRTWTLISKNLGGSIPGETFLGDLGNALTYNNLCFAENEEALPKGWNPLHVQKGYKAEESVVSILSGWSLINFGAFKPYPVHEVVKQLLKSFETSGAGMGRPTLLLSPVTADDVRNDGFETKEQLSDWLKENSYMTLWNYWAMRPGDLESAKAGVEPFASMLKQPPGADSPQKSIIPGTQVEILVVGGGTEVSWQAGDFGYVASASVDEWK
ncbi:MAG: hypothetical protein JW762_00040 [Dehalococcoidales bacterium]|nr:hypothetical protein [Dehalococcoidales bacterium]